MTHTQQLVATLDHPAGSEQPRRETFSYLAGSGATPAPGVVSGARVMVRLDGRSYPGQVLHVADTVDGAWLEVRLDEPDLFGKTLVHVNPVVVDLATGAGQ